MIPDIQTTQPCKSTVFLALFSIFCSIFAKLCVFVVHNMPLSNPINMSIFAATEGYNCLLLEEHGAKVRLNSLKPNMSHDKVL